MTTSTSNETYDTLISLRDKLTRLSGVITPEAIDKLEDELGGIFTVTKTHHYEQGQKYGHLVSAIPEVKYRLIIGDPTWTHGVPADPGAYSQTAQTAGNAAVLQEQLVAEHKILQKSYNDYLGVEEAGKELILYGVGDDALAPLKKLYISFGDTTVLGMIDHLRLKTAIKMTTAQKHEYKTMGYNNPWDPTISITAYFTQLDRFQVSLGDRRISTSKEEKTENNGSRSADVEQPKCSPKTRWLHGKTKQWHNRCGQSSRGTSPTSGWNANNIPQRWQNNHNSRRQRFLPTRQRAAEEEGESQEMLFAMLQEQHDKQIAAMAAMNKANIDSMMERMNGMVAGRGGARRTPTLQTDKENTPPGGNISPPTDTDQAKRPRKQKALCPHCKTFVLHKFENCYELEANKDKRWPGWKSVHATA